MNLLCGFSIFFSPVVFSVINLLWLFIGFLSAL